jgi:hypothetical protein
LADGAFAQFLEKLAQSREINPANFTRPDGGDTYTSFLLHIPVHLRTVADRYVFANHRHRMDPLIALLEYEDPIFLDYVPLTDNEGRLKIDHAPWSPESFPVTRRFDYSSMRNSSTFATVMVSSNADQNLAWQMVQQLITTTSTVRGYENLCLSAPILHSYFDHHYDRTWAEQMIRGWNFDGVVGGFAFHAIQRPTGGWFLDGDASFTPQAYEQLENMKTRILTYVEMPMTLPLLYLPPAVYEAPIEQFMLGLITAQAAAQEIHNRMSLWLIE